MRGTTGSGAGRVGTLAAQWPATRSLSSASDAALGRELRGRALLIAALGRRRLGLVGEIAAIERELASLCALIPSLGRPRRVRTSLPGALEKVLAEGQMNVAVLTEEVLRRGYRTTTDWFRRVVNKPLLSDARFVAVSRGVYALRGATARR